MVEFSEHELKISQIGGAIALIVCLIMGASGAFMLKHNIGVPEYATCLKNSGWTLALVACIWIGLATWLLLKRK